MKLSYQTPKSLLVSLPFLLAACVSSPEPDMQVEEKFAYRVNDAGLTEFAFGLVWQMDPSMMQDADLRNPGYGGSAPPSGRRSTGPQRDSGVYPGQWRGGNRFGYSLSNEEKLALEDEAVVALNVRLREENLCPQGHQLDDLIWESNRIRLMGHCL